MKLVVGLGNPGTEYADTRHNVGFLVVDELLRRGLDRAKARTLKPDTFMNLSGTAVAAALRQSNMTAGDVIVAYDDADLAFGDIRVRTEGGSAGHNGIKSMIEHLGTPEFTRVRVGIGRSENENVPLDVWVLGRWSAEEQEKITEIVGRAADEVEKLVIASEAKQSLA